MARAQRGGRDGLSLAQMLNESSEEDENDGVQDLADVHGNEDDWQNGTDDDSDGEVSFRRDIRIAGARDIPITVRNNDDSSDNDARNASQAPPRGRRQHHRNKAINCLSEALNPSNYDMLREPSETREVSAVLVNRTRTTPEQKIVFTNQKRTQRGRNPRLEYVCISSRITAVYN